MSACGPEACQPRASGLRWWNMDTEHQTATQTTFTKGKYTQLLEDPDIRRWYQSLRRSSQVTADVRLRRLGHFCMEFSIEPKELASRQPSLITDILDDCVSLMESKGKAPGYIKSTIVTVKSWLSHFGIQTTRRIRIRDADIPVRLRDEKVPERAELTELLLLGSLKARTIKQLIAKSGIRPGVIGDYSGTDGLRLRDIPDLALTPSGAVFLSHPPRLIVRPELSKTGQQYITFLTGSASATVLAYLNKRLREEKVSQDSALISPAKSVRQFLTSAQVSNEVRESIRPKFRLRPYALRSYFDTQLLQAEAKGLIPHDFRVFWMGHKGSIDAVYTTNKRMLPESLIQEMKDAFRRAELLLDLEGFHEDPAEKQRQQIQAKVSELEPETLGKVLELIQTIGGKTA